MKPAYFLKPSTRSFQITSYLLVLINLVPLSVNLLIKFYHSLRLYAFSALILHDLINIVIVSAILYYFIHRRPWAYYCTCIMTLSNQVFFVLAPQYLNLSTMQFIDQSALLFQFRLRCLFNPNADAHLYTLASMDKTDPILPRAGRPSQNDQTSLTDFSTQTYENSQQLLRYRNIKTLFSAPIARLCFWYNMLSELPLSSMFSMPINTTHKRTILMSVLIFLTVVGYNIMRGMKKTVILTFPAAGPEYIPFVKTTLVMPRSILIGGLYLFLRHRRGIISAYCFITGSFLLYFLLFTYTLLPNLSLITPSPEWIQSWQTQYPHFKFLIGMLSNWPIAFYYVAAELWGTYTLVVLFWQVANELYTPERRPPLPPFIFISSISIIIASFVLEWLSSKTLQTCTYYVRTRCMHDYDCAIARPHFNLHKAGP